MHIDFYATCRSTKVGLFIIKLVCRPNSETILPKPFIVALQKYFEDFLVIISLCPSKK